MEEHVTDMRGWGPWARHVVNDLDDFLCDIGLSDKLLPEGLLPLHGWHGFALNLTRTPCSYPSVMLY